MTDQTTEERQHKKETPVVGHKSGKQAISQNIRGQMIVPLNALQWSHMVVNVHGVSVNVSSATDTPYTFQPRPRPWPQLAESLG